MVLHWEKLQSKKVKLERQVVTQHYYCLSYIGPTVYNVQWLDRKIKKLVCFQHNWNFIFNGFIFLAANNSPQNTLRLAQTWLFSLQVWVILSFYLVHFHSCFLKLKVCCATCPYWHLPTSKNHLIGHMAFDINNKRYEKPFLFHFKSLFILFDGFYLHLVIFLAPISEKNKIKLGHDHQFLCNAVEIQ